MTRISKVAIALMAFMLLIAACSGGDDEATTTTAASGDATETTQGEDTTETTQGEDTTEPTTITLLVPTYSDSTLAIWEQIISDFEAQGSGVLVELEMQSWDNINDVVRTKIQGNAAPDILNIDAFAAFAGDGLLYPATDVASEATIADIQDSFVANASIDGVQYGFPLIASARTLFYNTDLFEQAGIDGPPATWEEALTTAQAISAIDDGIFGYGMPLGSEEAQAETSLWVFGAGGSWTDGTNVTVDTPANLTGVEFMKRMVDEGATQPDAGATDRSPLMNVFIQGQIGMMVGLPPTLGQIEERNPDLAYATAPIPTQDGNPVTLGVADHLMAFDNGEDKAEAIKAFIDFFYTPEVYLSFADGEGFLPTTKSGADASVNSEKFAAFLAGMPGAQFYPSTNPSWPVAQSALQSQIGRVAQGEDAAAILTEIQAKVDES